MCKGMVPVVDEFFLPDLPINLRKAGHVAAIPEMIGVTREEYTLFIAAGAHLKSLSSAWTLIGTGRTGKKT
jgi:carboxylesterase type B